jgi:hypothetical protein
MTMNVDIKTLEILADRMEEDAKFGGINAGAMRSVVEIIRTSIGAPIMWPSSLAGAQRADDYYPGSPDLRLAFNHGVKWAVEHYSPSVLVKNRFGDG